MSALSPGGPRLCAIGGGHGLARTLGAARRFAGEIAAVVSVADDGGSSGRLRAALSIPAPGDVRRCLGALLPERSPLGAALEHRFAGGELEGHAFGNLLLAALAATTGSFAGGVAEACRVLDAVGRVIPATDTPVVLRAFVAGREIDGQVAIMATDGIERVALVPIDAVVPPAAIEAIESAEVIVVGPGSLYTSVLAACAPGAVTEAVAASRAMKIYVCNLREQSPETAGYDVGRHFEALERHGVLPDVVLYDGATMAPGKVPTGLELVDRSLAGANGLVHDEARLAAALVEVLTGGAG